MAIGGAFVAGSIISKLIMDTTQWNAAVKTTMTKTARMGASLSKVGGMLTKRLTLPLALAGAAAVKASADFEQTLVNAFSVTGSSSEAVKQQMIDLAREMGATTVFAATEAAEAMYFMASAGWSANDMANALKDTLDLAAATQTDLAFATETVITTINQFQLTSAQAGRVSNVFASAISSSQATMDRLRTSMKFVGPVMNSLGKSVEETTSVLMGMFDAGISATTAGTALRMGLTKLMVPTNQSRAALGRLKLTFEEVNPETHKLADIIQLLGERGATTKDILMLFGQRAGPAFAALINNGGDALKDYEAQITGTNRAAEMAKLQIETFKGSFKLLTSALTETAISIGDFLAPTIRKITDKIREGVDWFNKLSDASKGTVVKIGLLVAALGPALMLLGKLLIILPKIKLAFIALTSPIGIVTAGLALIAVKALEARKEFKLSMDLYQKEAVITGEKMGWFEKTWKSLSTVIEKNTTGIDVNKMALQGYNEAQRKAQGVMSIVTGTAKVLGGGIKFLGDKYQGLLGKLPKTREEFALLISGKKELSQEMIKNLNPAMKALYESLKKAPPTLAEVTAEMARLTAQEELAKKAAEEWTAFMKSIGITTVQEKADRVKILEANLLKLHALYKSGAIDMKSYVDGTKKVNKEIKDLSTTLTTTAIPAARVASAEIALAYSDNIGKMEDRTGDFTKTVETKLDETLDIGKAFADTFALSFNQSLVGMLEGTMTWKDAVGNVLGALKSTAIQIFADIATSFVKDMVADIVKGTATMATNIAGSMATIGKGIAGVGAGLGKLIVTLAQAIASAAQIIAAAAPAILIAAGVALAIYAGFKLLQSLFAKKAKPGSELDFLRQIAENSFTIKDLLLGDYKNEIHIMQNSIGESQKHLFAIQARADRRNQLLTGIERYQKATAKATEAMADQLRNITSAQGGAVFKGTELAVLHGTPSQPEIAAPMPMFEKFAAVRGRSDVSMRTEMNFHIEVSDQLDPYSAQKITRETILPQMLRALEINDGTNRTKLEEILKLRI